VGLGKPYALPSPALLLVQHGSILLYFLVHIYNNLTKALVTQVAHVNIYLLFMRTKLVVFTFYLTTTNPLKTITSCVVFVSFLFLFQFFSKEHSLQHMQRKC
jgi:hypothetical protein